MEKEETQNILIEILSAGLNERELGVEIKEQITPSIMQSLYLLSKKHDLAHIVSSVLYQSGLLTDKELLAKFNKEEITSIYRHEQMKYEYENICSIFNRENIPYIPLKGSVIRAYYPEESMRTSCDIDLLIQEKYLAAATKALTDEGYTLGDRGYHDVSLFSQSNVHLELHFNILENIANLDRVLEKAWDYSVLVQGSAYEFSKEFFLFHIFAHMSYHFLRGGCGIRSLMDVWIMKYKMGITYQQAKELLEDAGIYQFAKEITALVDGCFSKGTKDEFSKSLLTYIFEGGVYGTTENKIIVKKSKTKNTFGYAFKRVFLPYRMMVVQFPVLKKVPILLPVFWVVRFFKMLFGGKRRKTMKELKLANQVTDEEVNTMKEIRSRLGLE